MEVQSHPNPQPHPHHRKIELQSTADLTYLQSNIARSARQKLALHFPPQPSLPPIATHIPLGDGGGLLNDEKSNQDSNHASRATANATTATAVVAAAASPVDPMRARVQELIDGFLAATWRGAAANITVNGLDADAVLLHTSTTPTGPSSTQAPQEGVDFTYAAYDPVLQARVAALHGELEALTADVARMRRKIPAKAAASYGAALQGVLGDDEEQHRAAVAASEGNADMMELELTPVEAGWQAHAEGTYAHGLRELERLGVHGDVATHGDGQQQQQTETRASDGPSRASGSASLTETVGKAQRARDVVREMTE